MNKSANRQPGKRRPMCEVLEDRTLLACNVLAGHVFVDANNNGLFEPGETAIANNPLELRNAAGQVIATTTSDAAGYYEFDADTTVPPSAALTQMLVFNSAKTNRQQTLPVPQFNPALGQLNAVEIIVDGVIVSDISVENVDDDPSTIVANVSGTLTVSGPGFSTAVTTSTNAQNFNAAGWDGVTDYGGTSGVRFGAKTATGQQEVNITAAADVARYVGTGSVSIREIAQASSTATGGGNLQAQISSTGSANVTVIYHYTPDRCLKPGTYTIIQKAQAAGYFDGQDSSQNAVIANSMTSDTISVTLSNADITNNDFGEIAAASIAGLVYADDNNDGQHDDGERGIGAVSVRLQGVDDLGRSVNLTAATGTDGSFAFTNLRPGMYNLIETQPTAYLDGKDAAGSYGGTAANDQITNISLPAGAAGVQYRFGEVRPAVLSGFVYVDKNDDGVRATTEKGIANVVITLTGIDDLGNAVNLTTKTAANGSYRFANLRPGMYVLSETQPAAYKDGKETPGSLGVGLASAANDQHGGIQVMPGDDGVDYNFGELLNNVPGSLGTGSGKIAYVVLAGSRRRR